jgi:putative hemolysin
VVLFHGDDTCGKQGVKFDPTDNPVSPPECRVFPRCPLPLQDLDRDAAPLTPPLVRAYLRGDAWVCGEPAWDPDFNTADLLIMLLRSRVDQRYAKHCMRHGA